MLPTRPQSIIKVVLDSIRAYQENIILIAPISMVLSALYTVSHVLVKIEQPWIAWIKSSIFFLLLFCFYGGICFVYDLLSKQQSSYLISLKANFRSFLKAILLPVVLIVLVIMIIMFLFYYPGVYAGVVDHILKNNLFLLIFSIMSGALLLAAICFSIVYTMEVMVKNSSIVFATKKAFAVGFRTKNIIRTFSFLILLMLLGIVVFMFSSIVVFLFTYIVSKLFISIPDSVSMMLLIFLNMTVLWIPLKFTAFIYFYNDLDLRFKSHYPTKSIFGKLFAKKWFTGIDNQNV